MPLPPALAAKLAKRGLINASSSTSARNVKNKENSSSSSAAAHAVNQQRFIEEVIAESYDDPKTRGSETGGESSAPKPGSNPPTALGSLSGSLNKKSSSGMSKFHRMGHYGCPNKSNIHHSCSQFCVSRWGRGKSQANPAYNRRRLKMLKKYPLPSSWLEVYDPGTGRYYYWETVSNKVCWLSPTHPKSKVGRSASDLRERIFEEERATASMPPPNTFSSDKRPPKRDRRRGKESEELDPMDPASYSDIPRGSWSTGLLSETKTGVDSTATGPLFQQRPYPSPGDILRANASKKK